MENWGLIINPEPLVVGRLTRTLVQYKKGERGWYSLYDFVITDKNDGRSIHLLTGAFGYFDGPESIQTNVALRKDDLPKFSKEEQAENRKRQAEAIKRAEAEQAARHTTAALQAQRVWRRCRRHGSVEYLEKKLIRGFDVRFTDTNAIVIPVTDTSNYIWGLQFILDKTRHKEKIAKRDGKNKEFWPVGMTKKGHFFHIGPMITGLALVCEGYATGATLFEATGLPVIVAFDATNLAPVVAALSAYYPAARFIICADDDDLHTCLNCKEKIMLSRVDDTCPHCAHPHRQTNAGVALAMKACIDHRMIWMRPKFADQDGRWQRYLKNKGKLTDFNDLHLTESLSVVRKQVEGAIRHQRWSAGEVARVAQIGGAGEGEDLKIATTAEAVNRIWLIYGTSLVFDERHKMIYTLRAFFDGCTSRDTTKQWRESKFRKQVLLENIGFDPAGTDPGVICNLFDHWPMQPVKGSCDRILGLIMYLCSGEKNAVEIAAWFLKWLAYPLQHPGAKMQTACVIYGPQGTGKNLLGRVLLGIYGKYGALINQRALETQFNDFLSKKLFIVANEIASISETREMKNVLKTFITDEQIWINPKGICAYFEKNHCNIMFYSNERMPVVLEHDDRRHLVMWTPPPKPDDYYLPIVHEIENGGIEAFYEYLLTLPLGDFNEHTKPEMTVAKQELIDLSKAPILRFYDEWSAGDIDGIPFVPAMPDDIYAAFKAWCVKKGCRAPTATFALDRLSKIQGVYKEKNKWINVLVGDRYQQKQKTFYFFQGCLERPPGEGETSFLTKCVEKLRAGITEYKGGVYD